MCYIKKVVSMICFVLKLTLATIFISILFLIGIVALVSKQIFFATYPR